MCTYAKWYVDNVMSKLLNAIKLLDQKHLTTTFQRIKLLRDITPVHKVDDVSGYFERE